MNNRDKGGSVTGRWASKPELEPHGLDPFKRPWVKGRRPWQFKDRPKFTAWDYGHPGGDQTTYFVTETGVRREPKFQGKSADFIIIDDVCWPTCWGQPDALLKDGTCVEWKTAPKVAQCDFAKIEQRIMANYQDAFYGTALWHSQQRALRVMEGKNRLDNSRRMIP